MAGGRPNKYDNQLKPYIEYIGILRREGMLYKDIAQMLNIAESTLYKHKAEIEEFSEIIKSSDDYIVEKTEATLYKAAWGEVKTTKEKVVYDSEGNIKSKEVTTDVLAPNVASMIFILTNKAPDKWSNTQTVTLDTNDNIAPSFSEVLKEAHETDK